jgi:GntR family transcriptional regulator
VRYLEIAEDLRRRLASGELPAGRVLPSESELGRAYAASRVTVRKALEVLREEGLVDARQGFGWFSAAPPVEQTLGRLGTIEAQLAESGRSSQRRILEFRFTAARSHVRRVLGADRVLEVRRINVVDDVPFARVTVWCPAELGRGLSLADVERATFHELLDVELGGATQTITAAALAPADADVLSVPAGSPALVVERVTRDVSGTPVLLSEHVLVGHLARFVVELERADRSEAPSGLRLVR